MEDWFDKTDFSFRLKLRKVHAWGGGDSERLACGWKRRGRGTPVSADTPVDCLYCIAGLEQQAENFALDAWDRAREAHAAREEQERQAEVARGGSHLRVIR
jgi:hypothetical protein